MLQTRAQSEHEKGVCKKTNRTCPVLEHPEQGSEASFPEARGPCGLRAAGPAQPGRRSQDRTEFHSGHFFVSLPSHCYFYIFQGTAGSLWKVQETLKNINWNEKIVFNPSTR